VEHDPVRMCELLMGPGEVEVLGVDDEADKPLRVHVRRHAERPPCSGCGGRMRCSGERPVVLMDLPVFGRLLRLMWHKRRWVCPHSGREGHNIHPSPKTPTQPASAHLNPGPPRHGASQHTPKRHQPAPTPNTGPNPKHQPNTPNHAPAPRTGPTPTHNQPPQPHRHSGFRLRTRGALKIQEAAEVPVRRMRDAG